MTTEQPHLASQFHRTTGSYELVLGPVLFGLVGLFIDRRLGTTPLFIIAMTVFALVGAAVSTYYRYRHQISELEAETRLLRQAADVARSGQDAGPTS